MTAWRNLTPCEFLVLKGAGVQRCLDAGPLCLHGSCLFQISPGIYDVDTMKSSTLNPKSKRAMTVTSNSSRMPVGKVFKSGNSAALRLPAGMQVPVGKTFVLTRTASGFVAVDPVNLAKRRRALAALFGSASDFPLRET